MMRTPTKIALTAAGSLFGVAVAASGAYAASGAFTVPDSSGHVLETTGVDAAGSASAQHSAAVRGDDVTVTGSADADLQASAHGQASAGQSSAGGSDTAAGGTVSGSASGSADANTSASVGADAKTGATVAGSSTAASGGSAAADGGLSADAGADAGTSGQVQVVAPDSAISLGVGLGVGGTTSVQLDH